MDRVLDYFGSATGAARRGLLSGHLDAPSSEALLDPHLDAKKLEGKNKKSGRRWKSRKSQQHAARKKKLWHFLIAS